MNATEFKEKTDAYISAIEDLINEMPDKEDSQKICLQNALNHFYYACNGVEDDDFEEEN